MELTEREMLVKTLQGAEADLRKKTTNVELRLEDVNRAQAAYEDAISKQVMVQNTCEWLRERLRDLPDEPGEEAIAATVTSRPTAAPATKSASALAGTLFGKPIPEITNTGLCLRALEQIGKSATTKEVREQIGDLGHALNQGQVRGALKYLAGRHDSPVENPEPGVWLLQRSGEPTPAVGTVLQLNNAAHES
jgi:hypothetical protein